MARGLVMFDPLLPVASDEALAYRRTVKSGGQIAARGFMSNGSGSVDCSYTAGTQWFPVNGYTFMVFGNWPAGGTYITSGYQGGNQESTFYLSTSLVRFFVGHGAGATRDLSVGTPSTDGTPMMAVGTWDGATLSTYKDGKFVASGSVSGSFAFSGGMRLHGRGDGGGSGLTSASAYTRAFAVWNRALSAFEIEQLYNDPFALVRRPSRVLFVGGGATQALEGSLSFTTTLSVTTLSMTYPLAGTTALTTALSGTTPSITYGLAGSTSLITALSGTTLALTYALSGTITSTTTLSGTLSLNGAVTSDPYGLNFTYRETGHTTTFRDQSSTTFREQA